MCASASGSSSGSHADSSQLEPSYFYSSHGANIIVIRRNVTFIKIAFVIFNHYKRAQTVGVTVEDINRD